jgi:hypothetical protein
MEKWFFHPETLHKDEPVLFEGKTERRYDS